MGLSELFMQSTIKKYYQEKDDDPTLGSVIMFQDMKYGNLTPFTTIEFLVEEAKRDISDLKDGEVFLVNIIEGDFQNREDLMIYGVGERSHTIGIAIMTPGERVPIEYDKWPDNIWVI